MAAGNTSYPTRLFDTWIAVYDRLCEQAWPAHQSDQQVHVSLVDNWQDVDGYREQVAVVPEVDRTVIEWRQSPRGRDERFPVQIVVRSAMPGVDGRDVVLRLKELVRVVERAFYDDRTNEFDPPDVDGVVKLGGLVSVGAEVLPTDEGHEGRAVLVLDVHARI